MKPVNSSTKDKAFIHWLSGPLALLYAYVSRTWKTYTIIALFLPTFTFATHIVGGQLEMVMINSTSGHFRVKMTYYYNEAQTANLPQSTSDVVIFRKSDGKKMAEFTLLNSTSTNRPPVTFANSSCALSNNLRISQVIYQADIQLDTDTYSDPLGYYMIQQNCCRNANIANLNNPQTTPFLFYLEFPALRQAGQAFVNSSPVFQPLIGDYICVGSPFTFSTVATDPDGDELRYSLVTPLAGTFITSTSTPVIKPAPYPEVNWRAGFGAQQAIPGNPALSIDAQTGILSVKASQTGLYVFSIRVEEFRKGVKLGEIRRDLQLLVLDCQTVALPTPAIRIQNRPLTSTEASLCAGKTIQLETTTNAAWNYQWSKNNVPINGATGAKLTASEPGEYRVTISLASGCSQRVSSEKVSLNDASVVAKLTYTGAALVCKSGGTVPLTAPSGYGYRWFRDGAELSNQTGETLTATQPGQYNARLYDADQGCIIGSDTVTIAQRPDPVITLTSPSAKTVVCPGDSVLLLASGATRYQWHVDGLVIDSPNKASFYAKTPGEITATGVDSAGCEATSPPFVLGQSTRPLITFDSIPPICGTDGPPVTLIANPPGGSFSGEGVVGNQFSPKLAGIGRHELTYALQSSVNSCAAESIRQHVDVIRPPGVDLPTSLTVYKGSTIDLEPILTGQPVQFSWEPTLYLSASDQPYVQALNVQEDIQYTIRVTGSTGCQNSDSIRIKLIRPIWIPDAFSPNGDGLNDTWQLTGIDAYPEAKLTIFNRWGDIVYYAADGYSRAFDGTFANKPLPTGSYSYVLIPSSSTPPLKGWVLLLR
ncbi:gliding motility-associated C-terminal domain-containing protein [Spirosoma fluviale]|uniref:Gliding motility-associated C-terminal domain-containing protein n=1 Tax=Spirosoma fluviale TaxID=1597977 RepID=A0A286GDM4_9BACT|nr:gliding motility-associated C-terminal domain-containing protein [Spirosoma fluviale]SOD93124.1 gliding motility-associated C-terminal domain-containing protein [Spirosoma fluviale]